MRSQSQLAPSLRSCFRMMPPCSRVQSQACSKKGVAGEVGLFDALIAKLVDHLGFRGNGGVVGTGHPTRVFALHAGPAYQDVLDGVVEHVAHVQYTGDVGWEGSPRCKARARQGRFGTLWRLPRPGSSGLLRWWGRTGRGCLGPWRRRTVRLRRPNLAC